MLDLGLGRSWSFYMARLTKMRLGRSWHLLVPQVSDVIAGQIPPETGPLAAANRSGASLRVRSGRGGGRGRRRFREEEVMSRLVLALPVTIFKDEDFRPGHPADEVFGAFGARVPPKTSDLYHRGGAGHRRTSQIGNGGILSAPRPHTRRACAAVPAGLFPAALLFVSVFSRGPRVAAAGPFRFPGGTRPLRDRMV